VKARGFTLIELMSALLILSLLAVMSFRGLSAVLDARDQVGRETEKWRGVAAFFAHLQRDAQMSSSRPLRATSGRVEFSATRPVVYEMNQNREIELSLWPAREAAPGAQPARYAVLRGVELFELQYLAPELIWLDAWPRSERDPPLPRALRLRIVLTSGEELVRVFALGS
jgi:general secretion pathway protein J